MSGSRTSPYFGPLTARSSLTDLGFQLLCFTVMDPAKVARRDQVVDIYVPQRGAILCLVLAEQSLELTQARHLGAVETEPVRYLR